MERLDLIDIEDDALDLPVLTNDMEAEEHAQKIRYWENYRARMVAHFKEQIELVNQKADSAIAWHNSLLSNYIHRIPHKITKTQETYELPSGKMVITKAHEALVRPTKESEQLILERLHMAGNEAFTKVEESLNWAEYKKTLSIMDGKAVDKNTGEVLTDVNVEMVEPKFAMRFDDVEDENNGKIQNT